MLRLTLAIPLVRENTLSGAFLTPRIFPLTIRTRLVAIVLLTKRATRITATFLPPPSLRTALTILPCFPGLSTVAGLLRIT